MASSPQTFTPNTLAERWRCSKATIIRMMKRGELRRSDFPLIRFSLATVEAIEAGALNSAPGRVYFIEGGGLLKIGYTVDPVYRMRNLVAMSPVPLNKIAEIPGTPDDEKALHKQFAEYRAHGEWFRIEGALAAYIQTLNSGDIGQ